MTIPTFAKSLPRRFLFGLHAALALLLGPLSVWLLFSAQTWTGRGIATAGLIVIALPVTLVLWRRGKARRRLMGRVSAALGVALVAIVAAILIATPDGDGGPDSPVRSRFTTNTRPTRFSISNIVPEVEQVNIGLLLMPWLNRLFTSRQASRLAGITFKLYRELESDPHFHRLGSAMGLGYAELLGRPFDVGHYFLYVPRNRGKGPMPVVVFLHGVCGNFKPYIWLWSKLAEQRGCVIIAPTYGFGKYDRPGSTEAVLRALDDAATLVDIDRDRVYLAGLSNGGLGVSQAATTSPARLRGLIFLSPVMERVVDTDTFLAAWRGRPVLVITGQADDLVPYEYVSQRVTIMKAAHVNVTEIAYPNEDHFLFFTQADKVCKDISAWLAKNGQNAIDQR